jgi:hypothetical protein
MRSFLFFSFSQTKTGLKENVEKIDLFFLMDDNVCFIDLEWKRLNKIDKIIAPNFFFFLINNDKP